MITGTGQMMERRKMRTIRGFVGYGRISGGARSSPAASFAAEFTICNRLPLEGVRRLHEHRPLVWQVAVVFVEQAQVAEPDVEGRLPVHPISIQCRDRDVAVARRNYVAIEPDR